MAASVTPFTGGARAVALVYDVTEPESFSRLGRWRDEIRAIVPDVRMVLIGNKIDLEAVVSDEEAQTWAREQGMPFLLTSAATGQNVDRIFLGLAYLTTRSAK